MSKEPNWTAVLRTLYNHEITIDVQMTDRAVAVKVAKLTGLDPESVSAAITDLTEIGLVETEHKELGERGYNKIRLTERGFQIAHEREMNTQQEEREDDRIERQNEINRAIGFLTVGLLVTTLFDTVVAAELQSNLQLLTPQTIVLVDLVLVLAIIGAISRSGVLTQN